jgi:fructose-bisphosphate aldolase, class I
MAAWLAPVIVASSRLTRVLNTAPAVHLRQTQFIIKLAIEGGCNAVASTYGVLGIMSRKYAHKIPFVVKINHNEFLSMPNRFDQTMFGTVKAAWDMGAVAVGATIYLLGQCRKCKTVKRNCRSF